jgi:outer membrane protein assembly factor BamA
MLANLELRFPIIRQLALGWPLPFFFQNVEGALFFDMGGAFDRKTANLLDVRDGGIILNGYNQYKQGGLAAGYGLGVRVNAGIFIFRYDLAWPTDLSRTFPFTGRSYNGVRQTVGLKQYFSADIQGLF